MNGAMGVRQAAVLLAVLTLLNGGCSRSRPTDEPEAKPVAETQAAPAARAAGVPPAESGLANATNDSAAAPTNPSPAGSVADSEPGQRLAALAQTFAAAREFDDRFEAALQIGQVGTPEAVLTLAKLFGVERDKEIKVELINALIGMSGCKEERLQFLKLGLTADQPGEVREAAIDGLVDLEDGRSLPLLEGLLADPDQNIRTLARQSRELVEKMLKAGTP
jgi:hypothetical protein